MGIPHDSDKKNFARGLRRSMTKEERRLWYDCLRCAPVKFYRQRVIGSYIVDFYCASIKLAVELDGSQHYDPEEQEKDARRTAYLNSLGIEVLRFSNRDVMQDFEGVRQAIEQKLRFAPKRPRQPEY